MFFDRYSTWYDILYQTRYRITSPYTGHFGNIWLTCDMILRRIWYMIYMTNIKWYMGPYQVIYAIQLRHTRYTMPICYLVNVSYIVWTYFCALHVTYILPLYLLPHSIYWYELYEYVYNNRWCGTQGGAHKGSAGVDSPPRGRVVFVWEMVVAA